MHQLIWISYVPLRPIIIQQLHLPFKRFLPLLILFLIRFPEELRHPIARYQLALKLGILLEFLAMDVQLLHFLLSYRPITNSLLHGQIRITAKSLFRIILIQYINAL